MIVFFDEFNGVFFTNVSEVVTQTKLKDII
jgi:hypothetical protein